MVKRHSISFISRTLCSKVRPVNGPYGEISGARDVLNKVTAVLYGRQSGVRVDKRHPRASSKRHLARYRQLVIYRNIISWRTISVPR